MFAGHEPKISRFEIYKATCLERLLYVFNRARAVHLKDRVARGMRIVVMVFIKRVNYFSAPILRLTMRPVVKGSYALLDAVAGTVIRYPELLRDPFVLRRFNDPSMNALR